MLKVRRESGVALVAAVLTMLVVAGILTIIFARTLNEVRITRDSSEATRTLLLARGAANVGVALLNDSVQAEVDRIVSITSVSQNRWAYDRLASTTSTRPSPPQVAIQLAEVSGLLQTSIDGIVCNYGNYGTLQNAVSLRIYFTGTACGRSLPNNVSLPTGRYFSGEGRDATGRGKQTYAIPFVLVAEGTERSYKRNVVLQGEYVFEIGRSSFARYAYFTENETDTNGSPIYFSDTIMIDGPVHTNGTFAFAYDPWFGGSVTSAGCTASNSTLTGCSGATNPGATFRRTGCLLWCDTFVRRQNMAPNDQAPAYGGTEPSFQEGVAWDARYIPLPSNSDEQKLIASGKNPGGATRLDKGITFSNALSSLTLSTVNSSGQAPTRNSSGVWSTSSHQIVTGCTATNCEVYRINEVTVNGVPTMRVSRCTTTTLTAASTCMSNFQTASRWTTVPEPFNGVIYTQGNIDRLTGPARTNAADNATAAPAVAAFAQLTVATTGRIRLTGDLKYEDRPMKGNPKRNADRSVTPAEYDNPDAKNILGIYSSGSDILVGNGNASANLNAPDDVAVDAVLMSARNSISVENPTLAVIRKNFYLLGGMIQNRRGIFGTFAGINDLRSGYNRIYTYDRRLRDGLAPPFFPTTGIDTVNYVRAVIYGQREQVY